MEPDHDVIVDSSEIADRHDDSAVEKREIQSGEHNVILEAPVVSHEAEDSMEVAESHIFRPIFRSKINDERIRRKKAAGTLPSARNVRN